MAAGGVGGLRQALTAIERCERIERHPRPTKMPKKSSLTVKLLGYKSGYMPQRWL
jgi:hypothetical protein